MGSLCEGVQFKPRKTIQFCGFNRRADGFLCHVDSMRDSLVNQLVIKAWDIVMSQLLVCEVDVRKEVAIGELAALMRATSSDQMLAAARAVARRWKGRDTSGLHKAAFTCRAQPIGQFRR